MYENEYGKFDQNQTSNATQNNEQGRGTYTDYTSYGQGTPNGGNDDKKPDKKSGKGKLVGGAVALVLAGVLAGGGVSYAYMSAHDAKADKNAEAAADEEKDKAQLQTADASEDEQDSADQTDKKETSAATAENTALQTTGSDGTMLVAQIADKCLSSVVAITNKGETEVRSMWGTYTAQSESAGSGIIIGQTDDELLILTNYHVVEDSEELSVVFSWEEDTDADDADITSATIKDYDQNKDIAVIAIKMSDLSEDTKSKITVATIGSSDDLALGEQVVAIGNALGYGQSVTTGIVSALDREITTSSSTDSSNKVTEKYIQTDAAINPGNSGGALFNMKGELVGVNSAKSGGSTVEGMGYAIPISDIFDDVQTMMNAETRTTVDEENRGYLGISIVDVTAEISSTYGMPQGAYIASVNDDSAAEKAGLEKEEIITAVNGKTVTSGSELKEYLSYYAIGDQVTVTVAHRGEDGYTTRDVDVTLGKNDQVTTTSDDENSDNSDSQIQGEGSTQNSNGFSFSFPFSSGSNGNSGFSFGN